MTHTPLTKDEISELLTEISVSYQRYALMLTRDLWDEASEAQETAERAIVRLRRDTYVDGL